MKFGTLQFSNKIELCTVFPQNKEKIYTENNIYSRNFKNSSITFDRFTALLGFMRTSRH